MSSLVTNEQTQCSFECTQVRICRNDRSLQRGILCCHHRRNLLIILCICLSGFLHPIIHLGYGVEFRQPAIIAEGLAQAACHEGWIGKYLLPADKAGKENSDKPSKTIVQLLDEIHADKKMNEAAHWDDGNKIRDGIIPRAGQEMIDYAAQFHVKPDELQQKNAEMTNAVCYYTAGAQHPPNMVMYDFYFM